MLRHKWYESPVLHVGSAGILESRDILGRGGSSSQEAYTSNHLAEQFEDTVTAQQHRNGSRGQGASVAGACTPDHIALPEMHKATS